MILLYPVLLILLIPLLAYLWKNRQHYRLVDYLRYATLMLLIIALSRPVIPQSPTQKQLPAHALIIALDLSASMRAEDIAPSRLDASKETIRSFLKQNVRDQIALIGFTTNPLLLSPPTTDHQLITMALETIRSDYILTKGTDLGKLLHKIASLSGEEKTVILFSDGGDQPIDEELIRYAQAQQITILAIAMATQRGSTIKSKGGELLRDAEENIVVSTFNQTLSTLATVIPFVSPDQTAHAIETWTEAQNQHKEGITHKTHAYLELYWIPTLLAGILLFLSATHFSRKIVPLLLLLGIQLEAGMLPDGYYLNQAYEQYHQAHYQEALHHLKMIETPSLTSELTKAHIYYQTGNYKQARSILKRLKTPNPTIKQQLLYELGNCEAKLAYYDKAQSYYVQALQLGNDPDALHNLAWVLAQKKIDHAKIGITNPQGSEASNNKNNSNSEENPNQENKNSNKEKSAGGGARSKSKESSIKAVQPTELNNDSKREMSSKAYDLINEGYIREETPW